MHACIYMYTHIYIYVCIYSMKMSTHMHICGLDSRLHAFHVPAAPEPVLVYQASCQRIRATLQSEVAASRAGRRQAEQVLMT